MYFGKYLYFFDQTSNKSLIHIHFYIPIQIIKKKKDSIVNEYHCTVVSANKYSLSCSLPWRS